MSFLGTVALIAAGAGISVAAFNKIKDEIEYKLDELHEQKLFSGNISKTEFEKIVKEAGEGIPRLMEIEANGAFVCGTVESKSGLTEWKFYIDFDDHGHITGSYILKSRNTDSAIPNAVATRIQRRIRGY